MLTELHVADLGVIDELTLLLPGGLVAVTGETGAGKTLIVGAIELLVGGRADASVVRPGAEAAVVDGRFELDGEEVVLSRVVPRSGRSRAYLDGRPVPASRLAEVGRRLVDLHGQHDHQSLLAPAVQRAALDRFGGVDVAPLMAARQAVADIDAALEAMGGDERARARELDLVRFQHAELVDAGLDDPAEDERLQAEELVLGDALAHREAGAAALAALDVDGGVADGVQRALAALGERAPFADVAGRLTALAAEVEDLRSELRAALEAVEEDPERLAAVQSRRARLTELRRKYGDTLAEVVDERDALARRVAELEGHEARAAELEEQRGAAVARCAAVEAAVGDARRAAAPALAAAVEEHLHALALPRARLAVEVGPGAGDEVVLRLAANPGSDPLPLAKVASGGELARTMLALRLVLTEAPPTLVFDEVDAGIGGTAAVAVGDALAALGGDHQVLVVTHLPQVAAAADAQVSVRKAVHDGTTATTATVLDRAERVVEVSRMLSGSPDSSTARQHAEELLSARGPRVR